MTNEVTQKDEAKTPSRFSPLLRSIAFALVLSFGLTEIGHAAPGAISLLPADIAQSPAKIKISPVFARVHDAYAGSSGKLLIHIQDAHTNTGAQDNLSKTLEELIDRYHVNTVFIEGGTKDDSLTFLRPLAGPEHRRQVAKKYMMKGELNGAEYLSLASDRDLKLQGVEESGLYSRNLKTYAKVAEKRGAVLAYISEIEKRVESLKRRLFSKDLLKLDETVTAFEKKDKDFTEYYQALNVRAEALGVPVEMFKNFRALKDLKALEDKIDFKTANAEQQRLLEAVIEKGGEEAAWLKNLRSDAARLNADAASPRAFYESLLNEAKLQNIELSGYSQLTRYTDYLKAYSRVDLIKLFSESKDIENAVYRLSLSDPETYYLHELSDNLKALKKLFMLQASTEDYNGYLGRKRHLRFDTVAALSYINKKLYDLDDLSDAIKYLPLIEDNRADIEDFYDTTEDRDEVFIDKAVKEMDAKGLKVAVLVTGGYHTPNLTRLMKSRGLSYAVITPNINEETNLKRYESLLLAQLDNKASSSEVQQLAFAKTNANALDLMRAVENPNGLINRIAGDLSQGVPGAGISGGRPLEPVTVGARLAFVPTLTLPDEVVREWLHTKEGSRWWNWHIDNAQLFSFTKFIGYSLVTTAAVVTLSGYEPWVLFFSPLILLINTAWVGSLLEEEKLLEDAKKHMHSLSPFWTVNGARLAAKPTTTEDVKALYDAGKIKAAAARRYLEDILSMKAGELTPAGITRVIEEAEKLIKGWDEAKKAAAPAPAKPEGARLAGNLSTRYVLLALLSALGPVGLVACSVGGGSHISIPKPTPAPEVFSSVDGLFAKYPEFVGLIDPAGVINGYNVFLTHRPNSDEKAVMYYEQHADTDGSPVSSWRLVISNELDLPTLGYPSGATGFQAVDDLRYGPNGDLLVTYEDGITDVLRGSFHGAMWGPVAVNSDPVLGPTDDLSALKAFLPSDNYLNIGDRLEYEKTIELGQGPEVTYDPNWDKYDQRRHYMAYRSNGSLLIVTESFLSTDPSLKQTRIVFYPSDSSADRTHLVVKGHFLQGFDPANAGPIDIGFVINQADEAAFTLDSGWNFVLSAGANPVIVTPVQTIVRGARLANVTRSLGNLAKEYVAGVALGLLFVLVGPAVIDSLSGEHPWLVQGLKDLTIVATGPAVGFLAGALLSRLGIKSPTEGLISAQRSVRIRAYARLGLSVATGISVLILFRRYGTPGYLTSVASVAVGAATVALTLAVTGIPSRNDSGARLAGMNGNGTGRPGPQRGTVTATVRELREAVKASKPIKGVPIGSIREIVIYPQGYSSSVDRPLAKIDQDALILAFLNFKDDGAVLKITYEGARLASQKAFENEIEAAPDDRAVRRIVRDYLDKGLSDERILAGIENQGAGSKQAKQILRDAKSAGRSHAARMAAPVFPDGKIRTLEDLKKQAIREALELSGGNRTQAALALGIGRPTLYVWLPALDATKAERPLFPDGVIRRWADIERAALIEALQWRDGNRTDTARKLGIGRETLKRRMTHYGISQAGKLQVEQVEAALAANGGLVKPTAAALDMDPMKLAERILDLGIETKRFRRPVGGAVQATAGARLAATSQYSNRVWLNPGADAREIPQLTRWDFMNAYLALRDQVKETPLWRLRGLSELTGKSVFIKDESRQGGGSFKARGVTYEVFTAIEAAIAIAKPWEQLYIVTQSTGNHGIAMIRAVIAAIRFFSDQKPENASMMERIIPIVWTVKSAPEIKLRDMRNALHSYNEAFGEGRGLVDAAYDSYEAALKARKKFLEENAENTRYMDHGGPVIAQGHGSAGIEIINQLRREGVGPDKKIVLIIPFGAGGPFGIAQAAKLYGDNVRVIGVQSNRWDAGVRSLESGKLEKNPDPENIPPTAYETDDAGRQVPVTFADGAAVDGLENEWTLKVGRHVLDAAVTVDEAAAYNSSGVILYDDIWHTKAAVDYYVRVGGTTALTAEALLTYANDLEVLREADVVVLMGTEGNVDSLITDHFKSLMSQAKTIRRDYGARLASHDAELSALLDEEAALQNNSINLVPSMTHTPVDVLLPSSVPLAMRAGKEVEKLAQKRWLEVFQRVYEGKEATLADEYGVNLYPHSGSQSNQLIDSLLKPGDTVLALELSQGGHLTHGRKQNASGIFYNVAAYGVDPVTKELDYEKLREIALKVLPRKIVGGATAYPGVWDWKKLRAIADEVEAKKKFLGREDWEVILHADIAHIYTQISVGDQPSPFGYADAVALTTQKSGGSRSGVIFVRKRVIPGIDRKKTIYDVTMEAARRGFQEEPGWSVVASKAAQAHWMMTDGYIAYGHRIGPLMRAFVKRAQEIGMKFTTEDGSKNHLALIDVSTFGISGNEAQTVLESVGIGANYNMIPVDTSSESGFKQTAIRAKGIRVGSPSMAMRGFSEAEAAKTAELIQRVLSNTKVAVTPGEAGKPAKRGAPVLDPAVAAQVRAEVSALAAKHPVPDVAEYAEISKGNIVPAWKKFAKNDPELAALLSKEFTEQEGRLQVARTAGFIPSWISALITHMFNDKYAEGKPFDRYYPMNAVSDKLEVLSEQRLLELWKAKGIYTALVQPNSHAQAVQIAAIAGAGPTDAILVVQSDSNHYPSLGDEKSFIRTVYVKSASPVIRPGDYDSLRRYVAWVKPKVIFISAADWSAKYVKLIIREELKEAADDTLLVADVGMATVPYAFGTLKDELIGVADMILGDTRGLGAPTGGYILASNQIRPAVNRRMKIGEGLKDQEARIAKTTVADLGRRGVIPGAQGGPLLHMIAAKAAATEVLLGEKGPQIAGQLEKNLTALARQLEKDGLKPEISSDRTFVRLPVRMDTAEAEETLEAIGLEITDDAMEHEATDPHSFIDIGVLGLTLRGFHEESMRVLADIVYDVLIDKAQFSRKENRLRVEVLSSSHPAHPDLAAVVGARLAVATRLTKEFYAPAGKRGSFEDKFKDDGKERGGWVSRGAQVLESTWPEDIEAEVSRLKAEGVDELAFVAMGGESSIVGPTEGGIVSISSTSPAKFDRLLGSRDISRMRFYIVSKSGSTKETTTNAAYLEKLYREAGLDPRKFITYVTDPGNKLRADKTAGGFIVKDRELNSQTSVGGRNTLMNWPTLLAYAWRHRTEGAGIVRKMVTRVVKAHAPPSKNADPWIQAAVRAERAITLSGRSKVAIIQPKWMRHSQWVWQQQNPEESLGKHNGGFTVYTSRPSLTEIAARHDEGWLFIEFRVKGHEQETEPYIDVAGAFGQTVITIPIDETDMNIAPQVAAYGWMKFVAAMGALTDTNFSDQPAVESYKKLMRSGALKLTDALEPAEKKTATVSSEGVTLVYDGLLPYLNDAQLMVINDLKRRKAPAGVILAKLLQFTEFNALTLAYYDDVDEQTERWLEVETQRILHDGTGYAAKWGEGTGVLHGLFVNWFSGRAHQIPIHIVATEHTQPTPAFTEGESVLVEGAVAAHRSLVEAKRPSLMLVVDGKLDISGRGRLEEIFREAVDEIDLQRTDGARLAQGLVNFSQWILEASHRLPSLFKAPVRAAALALISLALVCCGGSGSSQKNFPDAIDASALVSFDSSDTNGDSDALVRVNPALVSAAGITAPGASIDTLALRLVPVGAAPSNSSAGPLIFITLDELKANNYLFDVPATATGTFETVIFFVDSNGTTSSKDNFIFEPGYRSDTTTTIAHISSSVIPDLNAVVSNPDGDGAVTVTAPAVTLPAGVLESRVVVEIIAKKGNEKRSLYVPYTEFKKTGEIDFEPLTGGTWNFTARPVVLGWTDPAPKAIGSAQVLNAGASILPNVVGEVANLDGDPAVTLTAAPIVLPPGVDTSLVLVEIIATSGGLRIPIYMPLAQFRQEKQDIDVTDLPVGNWSFTIRLVGRGIVDGQQRSAGSAFVNFSGTLSSAALTLTSAANSDGDRNFALGGDRSNFLGQLSDVLDYVAGLGAIVNTEEYTVNGKPVNLELTLEQNGVSEKTIIPAKDLIIGMPDPSTNLTAPNDQFPAEVSKRWLIKGFNPQEPESPVMVNIDHPDYSTPSLPTAGYFTASNTDGDNTLFGTADKVALQLTLTNLLNAFTGQGLFVPQHAVFLVIEAVDADGNTTQSYRHVTDVITSGVFDVTVPHAGLYSVRVNWLLPVPGLYVTSPWIEIANNVNVSTVGTLLPAPNISPLTATNDIPNPTRDYAAEIFFPNLASTVSALQAQVPFDETTAGVQLKIIDGDGFTVDFAFYNLTNSASAGFVEYLLKGFLPEGDYTFQVQIAIPGKTPGSWQTAGIVHLKPTPPGSGARLAQGDDTGKIRTIAQFEKAVGETTGRRQLERRIGNFASQGLDHGALVASIVQKVPGMPLAEAEKLVSQAERRAKGARLADSLTPAQENALKQVEAKFGATSYIPKYVRMAMLFFGRSADPAFQTMDTAYVTERKHGSNDFPETELTDIEGNDELKALAAQAFVEVWTLDGGLGEKLRRADWKEWLVQKHFLTDAEAPLTPVLDEKGAPKLDKAGKPIMTRQLGAKGTDMGYFLKRSDGSFYYLSVSESKLLHLYYRAKAGQFKGLKLRPIVNGGSQPSYQALFERPNVLGIIADGSSRPMSYKDLLASVNVSIDDFIFQAKVPGLEKEALVPSTSEDGYSQEGGHGQLGVKSVINPEAYQPRQDGAPDFMAFTNGDNQVSSDIVAEIIGDMIRGDRAIGNLVTPATRADRKGGKYIVKLLNYFGIKRWIPDQRELAAAQQMAKELADNKIVENFYAAGQKEGEAVFGKGSAGKQPFNTNNFYVNKTRFMPFLADLKREMGDDAYLAQVIAPSFMKKDTKPGTKDGLQYYPLDSAIGNVYHNINEFVLRMGMKAEAGKLTDDEKRIWDVITRHKMTEVIHYYNVPRRKFTPQKNPLDALFQMLGGYYRFDLESGDLVETKPGLEPSEVVIKDDAGLLQDSGKGYYSEFMNMLNTFVMTDSIEKIAGTPFDISRLDKLEIEGNIAVRDVIFEGDVRIKSAYRSYTDGKTYFDLGAAILASASLQADVNYAPGSPLTLKNKDIFIGADGSVTIRPYGTVQQPAGTRLADAAATHELINQITDQAVLKFMKQLADLAPDRDFSKIKITETVQEGLDQVLARFKGVILMFDDTTAQEMLKMFSKWFRETGSGPVIEARLAALATPSAPGARLSTDQFTPEWLRDEANIVRGIAWAKQNGYIFGGGFGYDIRVNVTLDEKGEPLEEAVAFAYVLGRTLGGDKYLQGEGRALVTADQRPASGAFRRALVQGLFDEGNYIDTQFSDDVITTALPSRKAIADDYDLAIQVTGSHNPPQSDGFKITYRGLPFFAKRLQELQRDIVERAGWANEPHQGETHAMPLIQEHIDALDRVLPSLEGRVPLIADIRGGAAGEVFLGLMEKKGYEIVKLDTVDGVLPDSVFRADGKPVLIAVNYNASAKMDYGIWDPSKPEAYDNIRTIQERILADERNIPELDGLTFLPVQPGENGYNRQYAGIVFDGDGDRSGFIDEQSRIIAPERMLIAFYQRFILENEKGIRALNRLGQPLRLALDVRSSEVIIKVIETLAAEKGLKIEGEFIAAGFPNHRQFVIEELTAIQALIAKNADKVSAEDRAALRKLQLEYTSAEASGHFFFNLVDADKFLAKKVLVDDGIASSVIFLKIAETLGQFERPGETVQASVEAVDALFPSLPVTNEVRLEKAPSKVEDKAALAEEIIKQLANAHPELIPMPVDELLQTIEEARQTPPQRQPADSILLLVDGIRLVLTNGVWVLFRKSNTSAVIVFKAEARSDEGAADLVETLKVLNEAITAAKKARPEFAALDASLYQKETARLEAALGARLAPKDSDKFKKAVADLEILAKAGSSSVERQNSAARLRALGLQYLHNVLGYSLIEPGAFPADLTMAKISEIVAELKQGGITYAPSKRNKPAGARLPDSDDDAYVPMEDTDPGWDPRARLKDVPARVPMEDTDPDVAEAMWNKFKAQSGDGARLAGSAAETATTSKSTVLFNHPIPSIDGDLAGELAVLSKELRHGGVNFSLWLLGADGQAVQGSLVQNFGDAKRLLEQGRQRSGGNEFRIEVVALAKDARDRHNALERIERVFEAYQVKRLVVGSDVDFSQPLRQFTAVLSNGKPKDTPQALRGLLESERLLGVTVHDKPVDLDSEEPGTGWETIVASGDKVVYLYSGARLAGEPNAEFRGARLADIKKGLLSDGNRMDQGFVKTASAALASSVKVGLGQTVSVPLTSGALTAPVPAPIFVFSMAALPGSATQVTVQRFDAETHTISPKAVSAETFTANDIEEGRSAASVERAAKSAAAAPAVNASVKDETTLDLHAIISERISGDSQALKASPFWNNGRGTNLWNALARNIGGIMSAAPEAVIPFTVLAETFTDAADLKEMLKMLNTVADARQVNIAFILYGDRPLSVDKAQLIESLSTARVKLSFAQVSKGQKIAPSVIEHMKRNMNLDAKSIAGLVVGADIKSDASIYGFDEAKAALEGKDLHVFGYETNSEGEILSADLLFAGMATVFQNLNVPFKVHFERRYVPGFGDIFVVTAILDRELRNYAVSKRATQSAA